MSAFVNGALSAFDKVLNLLDIIDPDFKDEALNTVRTQIVLYKAMYKEIDNCGKVKVPDETWEKIKQACSPEDLDSVEQIKNMFNK